MYREHPIPAGRGPIEAWVDAFWSSEGRGEPHRVLPDGCMDLLFELDTGGLRLIGPMTRAEVVPVRAHARLFGVRFKPGRAGLLLDPAADELADCDIPAADLLGARARQLADAVCSAPSHPARAHVAAAFIVDPAARRRAPDARVERAVKLMAQSQGRVEIARVALLACVGERQLERLFRERVGLRPKLLARILRMQHTWRLAAGGPIRQAELAALGGYADEPHLVREFRRLCGATLAQIRRERELMGAPMRVGVPTPDLAAEMSVSFKR
jgi:AraC-like DNA-binding protein